MTKSEISNLVSELTQEDIKKLLWSLQAQKKIYIPQYYNNDHAKDFGFEDVDEMYSCLKGLSEQIDEIVGDFFYE